MPIVKLNPQLRTGGQIRFYKPIETIYPGQTCIAISSLGTKKFSFMVQVKELTQDESVIDMPILDVDKKIVGILTANDTVDLYPYNVPHAEKIEIAVSEEKNRGVVKGDWTSTLRPALLNKSYDLGDPIKAAVDLQGRMMIIRGNLIESYPEAPIIIDQGTQIILNKMPESSIDFMRKTIVKKKQDRVKSMEEMIREELKRKVAIAKTNLRMVSEELEFADADPRMIEHTISQFFVGYECVNRDVLDNIDKFSASGSFAIEKDDQITQVMEYSISGAAGHGSIVLRVYDQTEVNARQYSRKLWSMISQVNKGLKEKEEGIDEECPLCGGKLNLNNINSEGKARCGFCRQWSVVKKRY